MILSTQYLTWEYCESFVRIFTGNTPITVDIAKLRLLLKNFKTHVMCTLHFPIKVFMSQQFVLD